MHPAFNNLFLKYDRLEDENIYIRRNRRGNTKQVYLGCNLFIEGIENDKMEFEIDSSKAYEKIEKGDKFSNEIGYTTSPCVAIKRKIKLNPNEEKNMNFVISVSENLDEVRENLNYYKVQENIKREFNISKAKVEEEARYLNLTRNDLTVCQAILPYIMRQNSVKSLYLDRFKNNSFKQSDFWKYGISGDLPIILVLIKSINDIYAVKQVLKAHEYMRIKGIKTDLIILDYEKNIYEQYVKEQIIQEILNMQIGYLQNTSGGIFLLNKNEIQDEELFLLRANIVISASKGNVLDGIKEMEEEYKAKIKSISDENIYEQEIKEFERIKPNIDFEKLKYFNGYGGFSEDRKRIYYKS